MQSHLATILVCGPNRAARAFLADNLSADGHDVVSAPTLETAWQLLCETVVDAVLVELSDGGRTDRDGLELVARIRQAPRTGARVDPSTPVIVLAPRAGEVERLRVFEFGSDDLITHPYSYPELRARLGALLRRSRGEWRATRRRVGPLEIDATSHQAWLEARPLGLAGKEFALLAMLASEPSRVFTRGELLTRVWGFAGEARTRTVDVHASRLRRKLDHPREQFVINAWGKGYKLVAAASEETWTRPGIAALPGAEAPARLALVGGSRRVAA